MGKNKRLKSPPHISPSKIKIKEPSQEKQVSYDECYPVFCMHYIEDNYGLEKCTKDELAALARALRKRSQMTWREIWAADKHGLGAEKISRDSINSSMPSHITEDIEYFIALRFCGKAPMVGYRLNDVYRIIWLDRDFSLYHH
jgi:hypothetical protein